MLLRKGNALPAKVGLVSDGFAAAGGEHRPQHAIAAQLTRVCGLLFPPGNKP